MKLARTSLVISLLSLAITAISFLNQLVIARAFGASMQLDRYLQATSLPLLATGAFGGVFAFAMVPALTRATRGDADGDRIIGAFFVTLAATGILVAVVGALTAPVTLRLLSAGSSSAPAPESIAIARIAWVGAGASVLVGFATAVLNLEGTFTLPVALSALPYLMMSAAVLGAGRNASAVALAAGLAAGTALAGASLLVAARRSVRLRDLTRAHFEHVRGFGASAPLALLSVLTFSIYQSVDAFWAPRLGPSNLSVLGYCQRLLIAFGSIMATGPSIVLQPRLSASAAAGDEQGFARDLGRGLRLTILICLPAAVALSTLGAPVVRLAFERGAFDRTATLAVARLLPYMLGGMVPMVCTVMLFKALYARADLRTAVMLGVGGPVLYFAASGVLMRPFAVEGIGAAYLLTWTVLAVVGAQRIMRNTDVRTFGAQFVGELALVVAAVAVPAVALRSTVLAGWETLAPFALASRLAFTGVAIGASYLVVALLVARVADLRLLAAGLARR